MGKLTDEEFRDFLKTCRELAEGPFEEMQREVEVTNKFPQEFIDLARENNLYRYALPEEYGGWGFTEKEILQVQEEFSRGPGGMRMHLHYAADLNWRILDDYGCDESKGPAYMDKFADKTIFTCFALTEQTGGTGATHTTATKDAEGNWHPERREVAHLPHRRGPVRLRHRRDRPGQGGRRAPLRLLRAHGRRGLRARGHAAYDGLPRRGARRLQNDRREARAEVPARQGGPGHGGGRAYYLPRAHRRLEPRHVPAHAGDVAGPGTRDRVTFGKTINTRQAIKMKLADMACATHALRCMIIDFAEDYDRDPHNPYIAEKAAMCKLFSIEAVKKVSDEMLEIFGGDGYFEDSPYGPTERLYRDCRALWLEEGSPTIQRITIARELERHDGVVEYPPSTGSPAPTCRHRSAATPLHEQGPATQIAGPLSKTLLFRRQCSQPKFAKRYPRPLPPRFLSHDGALGQTMRQVPHSRQPA